MFYRLRVHRKYVVFRVNLLQYTMYIYHSTLYMYKYVSMPIRLQLYIYIHPISKTIIAPKFRKSLWDPSKSFRSRASTSHTIHSHTTSKRISTYIYNSLSLSDTSLSKTNVFRDEITYLLSHRSGQHFVVTFVTRLSK